MKRQPLAPLEDETLETLFQGKLAVIQGKNGYRFSLDAVLLAHFLALEGGEKIVDLGTGSGVIPLILAILSPSARVTGVELQKEMAGRALRSVALNRLEGRVEIVQGDICAIERMFPPRSFDAAVCNPPYRRTRSGRINPDPEKRIARHEVKGGLRDFIRAGSYLLRRKGRMALVYPAVRAVDLLATMRQEGLEPKRLRLIHSFAEAPATLLLVEGVKDGRSELKVVPPLVIYTRERKYMPEVEAMLISSPS